MMKMLPQTRDHLWMGVAIVAHLSLVALAAANFGGSLAPLYEHHDAIYYTAHLADPLLQGDLSWWDNIPYRALRSGFIVLALPFRWIGGTQALMIANLIGLAAGVVAIRRIAEIHGADSKLATLFWILNPGALISTVLLLPDTIAWAAILFAVLALRDKRWAIAAALTVFAVLTKEASIAAVGMSALVLSWLDRDWRPLIAPAIAGATHLGFLAFLTSRFGESFHGKFIGWPLEGWYDVLDIWDETIPVSIVAGVFVFISGLIVLGVWWRRKDNIFMAAAGAQALLMLLLQGVVIYTLSNTLRIAGLFWPMIVATRADSGPANYPAESSRVPTLSE